MEHHPEFEAMCEQGILCSPEDFHKFSEIHLEMKSDKIQENLTKLNMIRSAAALQRSSRMPLKQKINNRGSKIDTGMGHHVMRRDILRPSLEKR